MEYVAAGICLLVGMLAAALQRLYSAVPARELKRLAVQGDSLAAAMYRPVAFGSALRLLLWMVAGVSGAAGVVLAARQAPAALAFAIALTVLAAALVWLPSVALTNSTARLAVWCAPALAWVLQRTHRPLARLAAVLNRYRLRVPHTGLYEKADMRELLARQKGQADNRIPQDALERATRVLNFSDRRVADVLTPRKKVRLIEAHEPLGPVLLDELHASGQRSFLVFDGQFDNIVGTLQLGDALKTKQGGAALSAMQPAVTYVPEACSLPQALAALCASGQNVAAAVDGFGEIVGTVSLAQLLQELAGELPTPMPFDNRAAAAAFQTPAPSPETDANATEPDAPNAARQGQPSDAPLEPAAPPEEQAEPSP